MAVRSQQPVVRTPFPRRLLWWRRKFLPVVVWAAALVAIAVLFGRHPVSEDATGVVVLREIPVAPVVSGRVERLAVGLFDEVEAGQVVALLDDSLIRAEVTAERERLTLEAAAIERDALNDERRFALAEAEARLDLLDREMQHAVNVSTLDWLKPLLERQELLARELIVDQATVDEMRMQYEALEAEVRESAVAREASAARLEQAQTLKHAMAPDALLPQEEMALAPLEAAIAVQQAHIQFLHEQRANMVLIAPVDGHIARILAEPGAVAAADMPVLVVTAKGGDQAVAYMPEHLARNIPVGSRVRVASRRLPRRTVEAKVLKVSPQIEPYPLQLQPGPNVLRWGAPVLVGQLPEGFLPGEVVNVRFLVDAAR